MIWYRFRCRSHFSLHIGRESYFLGPLVTFLISLFKMIHAENANAQVWHRFLKLSLQYFFFFFFLPPQGLLHSGLSSQIERRGERETPQHQGFSSAVGGPDANQGHTHSGPGTLLGELSCQPSRVILSQPFESCCGGALDCGQLGCRGSCSELFPREF